ncbi:hypothetical protein KP509_31G011200 [Ceratopteris richardii]|nr:hypothetical protein KP509_31G011200 [Ceratopteris richardii]
MSLKQSQLSPNIVLYRTLFLFRVYSTNFMASVMESHVTEREGARFSLM